MTGELRDRVDRVRAGLAARPDGYTIGSFPAGLAVPPADLPPGLGEVLRIADGARAGVLVLFSAERLAGQHFEYDDLDQVDDPTAWLRIGTNNDEPLLMHRKSGELWWFPDTGTVWYMSDRFERLTETVADFVAGHLLGDGYLDISPGPDEWFAFLRELGLAGEPGSA